MKINDIQRIEFFNREKEKQEILNILRTEPQIINFIYGLINSGKTTLITNLIENLSENYVVFYINLRQNPFSTYKDFLEELFDTDFEEDMVEKKIKKAIPDAIADLKTVFGIPIPLKLFERIFSSEDPKSAFRYLLKIMRKVKEHNKIPVLIIDELRVIGDLNVDGKLIYKLFNFFIALTKELRVCHVFALSSDSLFIEKVYNEAMLQDRCKYLLVDDFDKETTKKFLEKYTLNKEEQEIVWNSFGGKPIFLSNCININFAGKDINEEIRKILKMRKGQIEEIIYTLKDENEEMFKGCTDVLEKFRNSDNFDYLNVTKYIRFLCEKNIIFVNSAEKNIKAQSKINLIAIKEILKEMTN